MSERRHLAPLWHTAILVGILLALAAYGASIQHRAGSLERQGSAVPMYLVLIVSQWALLRFVTAGMRRSGVRVRDLLGERWSGPREIARDVALALLVWGAWSGAEALVHGVLGPDTAKDIGALLPRSPVEIALWVLLSLTAGFCEEVIFRGYLQKQVEAITRSAAAGLLIQALIFGVSHGYQGLRNVILITIFGALFGALALWRRSLKPGILLHAWTDVFGGIFAPRL